MAGLAICTPIQLNYDGKTFLTPEALFQWLRFNDYPEVQNEIYIQSSPNGCEK